MFAHPHITNVPSGLCRKEHGINNKNINEELDRVLLVHNN